MKLRVQKGGSMIEDKELQTKMIDKLRKLRRLNDEVGDYVIRKKVDEYLCRAFLMVRDGNEDQLNGGLPSSE